MKTLGWLIAVSALLITIPRYARVLQRIDNTWATAIGMGILLGGGAAYIFHAWATTKRAHSWRLLLAFGINLAYEPLIITPFVLAGLWHEDLAAVMGTFYAVLWSLVVATAPILLVAGVVMAIAFQKESRSERSGERSERDSERAAIESKPFKCDKCSARYATQAELSGHGNKHRTEGTDEHR